MRFLLFCYWDVLIRFAHKKKKHLLVLSRATLCHSACLFPLGYLHRLQVFADVLCSLACSTSCQENSTVQARRGVSLYGWRQHFDHLHSYFVRMPSECSDHIFCQQLWTEPSFILLVSFSLTSMKLQEKTFFFFYSIFIFRLTISPRGWEEGGVIILAGQSVVS